MLSFFDVLEETKCEDLKQKEEGKQPGVDGQMREEKYEQEDEYLMVSAEEKPKHTHTHTQESELKL